jgi:preprotein translocase subunit YajC
VTNAGIHGTVMSTEGDTVVLRVDDKNNVRIKFSRAAIWQVIHYGSGQDASEGGVA